MIAERIAAFLGLCCAFINESTFSRGIESFAFKVSTCCAKQLDELNKKNERTKKKIREGRERNVVFFCMMFPSTPPTGGVGDVVILIQGNIHLPENVVEFIEGVIFNIDLPASIAAVLKL